MKQAVYERLNALIKGKRYSVNALSKELNMNQKTLNNQLTGNTPLSVDTVCAIAKLFPDVSADWILFGVEPMLRTGLEKGGDNSELVALLQKQLEEEKERSNKYWETIQKLIK